MWQILIFFLRRSRQKGECKPRYCQSELCQLKSQIEEAEKMGAKTIKTTPEKLCKMIDSFEDDARCGDEIKTKRRRCLRRKRWTKHGSCKFGKIFKQVTKRRRRKRRLGTIIDSTRSLGALRAPTSSLWPFGPPFGPSGLLDFVLRALRPCD